MTDGETIRIYKLAYNNAKYTPDGLLTSGDIIRTENATAEVIGTNYARNFVYLGKVGRRATDLHVPISAGGAIVSPYRRNLVLVPFI